MYQKLCLLLAIPHTLLRAGLRAQLVSLNSSIEIIEVRDVEELAYSLQKGPINYVLLHQKLLDDGIELLHKPFIVLAGAFVREELLELGKQKLCYGYISDQVTAEFLMHIFSSLILFNRKVFWLDPFFAQALLEGIADRGHKLLHIEKLTPREHEVFMLCQQRQSDQAIAIQLSITADTVRKHVANICQKLSITGRQLRYTELLSTMRK